MQSWIKTLLNGVRATLDGCTSQIAGVREEVKAVEAFNDSLAWVARRGGEKLPNEFLDMDWIPVAGWTELLPATTFDGFFGSGSNGHPTKNFYQSPSPVKITEGNRYRVNWGGYSWECTGGYWGDERSSISYVGNPIFVSSDLDDLYETFPFLIATSQTSTGNVFMVVIDGGFYDAGLGGEDWGWLADEPLQIEEFKFELPEEALPQSFLNALNEKLDAENPKVTGSLQMDPYVFGDYEIGEKSAALGRRCRAEGDGAFAAGNIADARGPYSVALGDGVTATAIGSAVLGGNSIANGENSVAIGYGVNTIENYSIAIGLYVKASSANQLVLGQYNVEDTEGNYSYIVGNGTASKSRNAQTIDRNGDAWFSGEVYVGSTSGTNRDEGSVKLLKESGDGSDVTVAHTAATSRTALTSGEKLSTALGKIAKWLADLGTLAFKSSVGRSELDTELQSILENSDVTTKMDKANPTGMGALSLNRKSGTTVGDCSVAEGLYCEASGGYSHAEGYHTKASSAYQHVQGKYNVEDTEGRYVHIVGDGTDAVAFNIHTLDWGGNAWFAGSIYLGGTGQDSVGAVELDKSTVKYVDGSFYTLDGTALEISGGGESGGGSVTVDAALNETSGNPVQNKAIYAAISAIESTANTAKSTANTAESTANTAESTAKTAQSTAEAAQSTATTAKSTANTAQSTAEAAQATANTAQSTAEAAQTNAVAALVELSAKMDMTDPTGTGALSLNRKSGTTVGDCSVAEGLDCEASGSYSHAEGHSSTASGMGAHAEGLSAASGQDSHSEGFGTKASSAYQHVQGKYNVEDTEGEFAHIVGGGTSDGVRKNIHTLDWEGNAAFTGAIECTGIIMKSPDGTKYKITVDNGGTIKALVTA